MKHTIIAGALFLGAGVAVHAADLPSPFLPTKAPLFAPVTCTPKACTGMLVGFNIEGLGTNFDVIGQGVNGSINAAGSGIGAQFGYQYWDGSYYLAGRGFVDYLMTPASAPDGSNTGRVETMEVVSLGMNLLSTGATPTPPTTFPTTLLAMLTSPYLNVGMKQSQDHRNGTVAGAGLQYVLAHDATLNVDYFHISYSAGGSITPVVAAPTDNRVMLSFNKMIDAGGALALRR